MKGKSIVSIILLSAMLCTTVLTGCGENNEGEKEESSKKASVVSKVSKASEASKEQKALKPVSQASTAKKKEEKKKEESKAESSEEEVKTIELKPIPTKIVDDDNLPIPEIKDPTPDNWGEDINNIFVYNGVAYEHFYGDEYMAQEYSDVVSYIKKQLGKNITVYNVIVPTHMGVDLPEKFEGQVGTSQKDYMHKVVTSYTEDVIGVDTFDKMAHHRNEYLYFNSDHHWTSLGAYYAYRAFAQKAGFQPLDLMKLKTDKYENFYGTFTTTYGVPDLIPDTVHYYYPDYDIECQKFDEYGNDPWDWQIMNTYVDSDNASFVFLGGDYPLIVSKNPKGNGKKVAVMKESFGNFFSPYICYTYGETHIIDPRHLHIDLKSYLEKNGITEVIIINNVMASASQIILDAMRDMVSGANAVVEEVSNNDEESEDTTNESSDENGENNQDNDYNNDYDYVDNNDYY